MKVTFFSMKPYDQASFLDAGAGHDHELAFLEPRLTTATAALARGADAVCAFVNDELDEAVLSELAEGGTRLVVRRCTGFNHVDLLAAARLGLTVAHVPAYSPYAVAEHTVALLLTLNRKIHRAHTRVREGNFALHGLLGFDLHGKAVGVVGTGAIGTVLARILAGFGCRVLAFDPFPNEDCRNLGVSYVTLHELFTGSDVVSLHCPLTPDTYHLVDEEAVAAMPDGVMIVNTSRGALVDTTAVIAGLATRRSSPRRRCRRSPGRRSTTSPRSPEAATDCTPWCTRQAIGRTDHAPRGGKRPRSLTLSVREVLPCSAGGGGRVLDGR